MALTPLIRHLSPRVFHGAALAAMTGVGLGLWLSPPSVHYDPDPYRNFALPLQPLAETSAIDSVASQPAPLTSAVWSYPAWTEPRRPQPEPVAYEAPAPDVPSIAQASGYEDVEPARASPTDDGEDPVLRDRNAFLDEPAWDDRPLGEPEGGDRTPPPDPDEF